MVLIEEKYFWKIYDAEPQVLTKQKINYLEQSVMKKSMKQSQDMNDFVNTAPKEKINK